MKKTKYIFLIMAGLLVLSSCEKFLDEPPRGMGIAKDVTEYNGLFNTISLMNLDLGISYYSYWKNDENLFIQQSYNSLLQMADLYANAISQSVINAFQYKDKVYRADEECAEWIQPYKQIYTYNLIANGVTDATGPETQKKYLEAEARVTRAYMHFLLAQWFAMPYNEATAATELAVPIVTKASTQDNNFTLATMEELYKFVTDEMETYCPQLEERTNHKRRVYKAAGYTMLGKVYWMMGKYDKAIAPLTKAKELLNGDSEVSFYDYNVVQTSYGYTEIGIMALAGTVIPVKLNSNEVLYLKQNALSYLSLYAAYFGTIVQYLKPEIYAMYDNNDLRRNLIVTAGMPQPYAGMPGAMVNLGVELPELYLMLAESEARAGSESNARSILQAYREKRMLTGHAAIPATVVSKNDLIRFCVDEQTREYVGTGHRWYNIRRLWDDPLFQDMKPITHSDGAATYTLQEAQLKMEIPETVLIWHEDWR
ncbi:MAG: RagB/SusD family nutrient uptake outer membrane protein [Prevotellaceae bacterium]|jgi:tetratricopeptide (TPR) repeat protein|nr:RagB/SusD family nutrient uptake outer membrane protein [Prevotellaceae bacterium]